MKRNFTFITLFFLALATTLNGQGWERTFGGTNLDLGYSVLQTPNGDFIGAGSSASFSGNNAQDIYIVRTDIDGNTIWESTFGDSISRERGQSMIEVSDGNYLIAGYSTANDTADENIYLLKIDPFGNELWSQTILGPNSERGYQVIETNDNGFAIIGITKDTSNNQTDIYLSKTDANGNEVWNESYGGEFFDGAYSVHQKSNGDFVLAGYLGSEVGNDTIREAVLIKTDPVGLPIDTFTLGEANLVDGANVIPADDDGYIVAINNDFSVYLKKVTESGGIDWSKEMPNLTISVSTNLIKTTDGGFALIGSYRNSQSEPFFARIIKTDNEGEIDWQKTHGSPVGHDIALGVTNAMGNGFGIIGYTTSWGAGNQDYFLLMTDSLGNTWNNYIEGRVYYDLDEECDFDASEIGLNDWLLQVEGEDNTYYGLTDEAGNYQIAVESGDYTLNLIPLNEYWISCENNLVLNLSGPYDTATVDFPLQSVYECPLLEVDIATPFLRRCFDNMYTVNYCNDGTTQAIDAQVEVELDEYLIFNDATNPDYTVDGNTYLFDVGNLDVGECGLFYIDVTVDCDSTLLGQAHCVEARIAPDSICSPVENCWEMGSIELDASCEGDSVRFTVKNVGINPITEALGYVIVEDHLILNIDDTLEIDTDEPLEPGDSLFIVLPVDGQTLRLEVDQVACHPGNSTPAITVEGCGLVDDSEISLGYLTQYFEDDSNPFVSIDCQENIGSWDPNDKRGFPKGYEDQHYIKVNQEMDYIIRFQNTGSDTAFRVVVRDTLSELLDIRDVQAGAASHEYDFEIYGENIIKFTFDNINLPDSTTNEVASHGFVKFRIAQQADLPVGSVIYNSTAIYFDYNEPVITNETWHTIGEDFIELVSTNAVFTPGVHVYYYPNPFKHETTFEISFDEGATIPDFETKTFSLYDQQGRLVRREEFDGNQFRFQRNGLNTGLYFFQIEIKNNLIFGGKLIAH